MEFVPTVLIQQWTYLGVLIVSLAGQIGFPIPEEVIYIMAGYLASAGVVNFWWMLLFCIFVITLTNNLSYWAGYFFGSRLLKFLSRWKVLSVVISKMETFFNIHGTKAVFFARFIWNVRNWIPLLAGSHKMKWWDFQKYDFLAACIYTPILLGVGYFFAEMLQAAIGKVLEIRFLIFMLFLIIVVVIVLRYFYVKFFVKNNLLKSILKNK